METMMMVGMGLQAVSQIAGGMSESKQLKQQAALTVASAEADVSLEKAAAAERTVDRVRQLRMVLGDTVAAAGSAGVGVGSVGALLEDASGQYAREKDLTDFNVRQSGISKTINAQAKSSLLKAQAYNAKIGGFMAAGGTLLNYGIDKYNRGSVE